jgi:hypothetical protein
MVKGLESMVEGGTQASVNSQEMKQASMTNLLQDAIGELGKLPPDEQDAFAARILDELRSEQRWHALFSRSPDLLAKLANEAMAEHETGLTLPLDPDNL